VARRQDAANANVGLVTPPAEALGTPSDYVALQQAVDARPDAERIAGGQATAGLVLVSNHLEASATRLAAESSLVETELKARVARAELARAGGRLADGN
jgi:hypothetical protein